MVPFRQGKLWGFSDRAGRMVIAPAYDRASVFTDGPARVAKGGKWGFIDRTGRELFDAPPLF